jgi:hypothetical protein
MHLTRRVLEDDVGEHSSIRLGGQVRAEADTYVKRPIEVQGYRRAKLVHGFALQTDVDGNGIAVLFEADVEGYGPAPWRETTS